MPNHKVLVTASDSTLLPKGAIFHGRYQVFRRIGRGGMGEVYEVRDLSTRKPRALKVMLPDFVADSGLRARFEQEARITADVDSEHIVEIVDAGTDGETGFPFIAMELLKGEDLGAGVRRQGSLPPEEVVTLLRQAADALDKTHQAGVVHRDLKPENLFLTRRGDGSARLKVLDFGIAKFIATSLASAKTTCAIGTPLYMAPEQFRGDGSVDARADTYALGHIAFALLVGVPYWTPESANVNALMKSVERGIPEPATARALTLRNVRLAAAFDPWFSKATATTPQLRFDTASESVEELATALGLRAVNGVPRQGTLASGHVFRKRYLVVGRIGEGGMGEVYEVLDQTTGRPRALKLMHSRNVADAALRRRFLIEAKITAGIESKHLVEVVDAADDIESAEPFIVMELLRGETLAARLSRSGGLSPSEAVALLRQAAEGLAKAHDANIVHRDLKPENLFLTRSDDGIPVLKIIDFGLAKVIADAPTAATNALGTPLYMAPEQFSPSAKIDQRVDIYSLGQIAFTMLTGASYWQPEAAEAANMFQLLYRINATAREAPVVRAARLWKVVLPGAFDAWFSRATGLDPAERFPSTMALADAFADVMNTTSRPASRQSTSVHSIHGEAASPSIGHSSTQLAGQYAPPPHAQTSPRSSSQITTIKLPDRVRSPVARTEPDPVPRIEPVPGMDPGAALTTLHAGQLASAVQRTVTIATEDQGIRRVSGPTRGLRRLYVLGMVLLAAGALAAFALWLTDTSKAISGPEVSPDVNVPAQGEAPLPVASMVVSLSSSAASSANASTTTAPDEAPTTPSTQPLASGALASSSRPPKISRPPAPVNTGPTGTKVR